MNALGCTVRVLTWTLDIKAHWCRTKAKAERWKEEKILVEEEMKRTLRFFAYYERLWRKRGRKEGEMTGARAYAKK